MADPQSSSRPAEKPPNCPKCNKPLTRKGQIKEVGFLKKWVEEWHCETHGAVELPGDKTSK